MLNKNKIKEIVNALADSFDPTEEQKSKAESRYEICLECDSRKSNGLFDYCKECGCPLKGKVYSRLLPEDGACPKYKWKI